MESIWLSWYLIDCIIEIICLVKTFIRNSSSVMKNNFSKIWYVKHANWLYWIKKNIDISWWPFLVWYLVFWIIILVLVFNTSFAKKIIDSEGFAIVLTIFGWFLVLKRIIKKRKLRRFKKEKPMSYVEREKELRFKIKYHKLSKDEMKLIINEVQENFKMAFHDLIDFEDDG